MKIDRTHRPWIAASIVGLVVATAAYTWYAASEPGGPRGGTSIGLAFGLAGYTVMLFEGLLGARKKVPVWRLGRAQTWMRGHLWLGLLTLPIILFHAGFQVRGPLTRVLMGMLFLVCLSGIAGALIQHYLPRLMTTSVPMETIYEEIPHVQEQLLEEADQLVHALAIDAGPEDKARFREAYQRTVKPFLAATKTQRPDQPAFTSLRRTAAPAFEPVIDDLENICEEHRQLCVQRRIYHWMHAWQLVHVPLSVALLILGGVHAIVALRY